MHYLENFCFLCLKPGITTTLHNTDVEEKLEYLISTYQLLQLSKIPKHFCDNCLENLSSFYDFKHKCEKSIVISNYYAKKLDQENSTFACLSVELSDILHIIKSDTVNSIDANVVDMKQKLVEEIVAIDNHEQHKTVEIELGKANNEQVSIKIENETDYLEMKREITEELIIKDENFDNSDYIFECKTCLLSFSTEILLIEHTAGCKNRTRPIKALNQIQSDTESDNSSDTTEDTLNNVEESSHAFSELNTSIIYPRTHSDIKLNKCSICKQKFSPKCNLKQHECIHTGQKPYKCNVCQKTFSQRHSLKTHKLIHTGEKPYKCDICERSFRKKDYLIRHKNTHTGEKPYECDVCRKSFNQNSYLNIHKRIHTGEKPYHCDVCEKSYSSRSELVRHKHIHTGKKPNECEVCKKSFIQKSCLKIHKRIHTGEKPYECDVCKKSFSIKCNLIQHKHIHTGKKPNECEVCKKSFIQKYCLKIHKRIHTGEKPYECDFCKKMFTRKSTLIRHKCLHTG